MQTDTRIHMHAETSEERSRETLQLCGYLRFFGHNRAALGLKPARTPTELSQPFKAVVDVPGLQQTRSNTTARMIR